jgi:hypothetical protein
MHRFAVLASVAFAAASFSCTAHAQGTDTGAAPIPDPPDTEYSEGALPTDAATVRQFPVIPKYRAYLPARADLSGRMPAPGSQGKLGSCVAWAVGYAARSYYTETIEGRDLHSERNLPSPNYMFHLARENACEVGSKISRNVDVLKRGALSLAEYPYSAQCLPPASAEMQSRATDFRVRGLRRVDFSNIDNIKGQLATGNPVIFMFLDTEAFKRFRGGAVFKEQVPANEKPTRHTMTLVGYDDARQAFRLINSWGNRWGDRGYAWLSYDVAKTRFTEAYTLDVAPPPRPTPVAQAQKPAVQVTAAVVTPAQPARPPATVTPQPQPLQPNAQPGVPRPESRPPVSQPAVQTQAPAKVIAPVQLAQPAPAEKAPVPLPQPAAPKAELADLSKLSCGKVAVQVRDNRNVLFGFVGADADIALVNRVAADVPNTSVGGIVIAPWPQCEALLTLEKPLVSDDAPKFVSDVADELKAGENFKFEIQSPAQINYLYVSYIQADGSVLHLVQPHGVVPKPTLPNTKMLFGDGKEGRARFTVGGPYGREMIIALASRSPLFDSELPAKQTEREYLTALRRALIYKPSPDMPDREVTASIKMMRTKAR